VLPGSPVVFYVLHVHKHHNSQTHGMSLQYNDYFMATIQQNMHYKATPEAFVLLEQNFADIN